MKSNTNRKCPKCGSTRLSRSHRRGVLERALHWLGADIRRCHDCRMRRAWYGRLMVPLASVESAAKWGGLAVMCSGCLVCLLLVWWMAS